MRPDLRDNRVCFPRLGFCVDELRSHPLELVATRNLGLRILERRRLVQALSLQPVAVRPGVLKPREVIGNFRVFPNAFAVLLGEDDAVLALDAFHATFETSLQFPRARRLPLRLGLRRSRARLGDLRASLRLRPLQANLGDESRGFLLRVECGLGCFLLLLFE